MFKSARLLPWLTLASILIPGRAEAGLGWIDWLQELSGPGPFSGITFDVGFQCKSTGVLPQRNARGIYQVDARGRLLSRAQQTLGMKADWGSCWKADPTTAGPELNAAYVSVMDDVEVPAGHIQIRVDLGSTVENADAKRLIFETGISALKFFSNEVCVLGSTCQSDRKVSEHRAPAQPDGGRRVPSLVNFKPSAYSCELIGPDYTFDCTVNEPNQELVFVAPVREASSRGATSRDIAALESLALDTTFARSRASELAVVRVPGLSPSAPTGRRVLFVAGRNHWVVDHTRRRRTFGYVGAILWTDQNHLQYSPEKLRQYNRPRTWANVNMLTVGVGVHPAIDIGAGVGWLSFSGRLVDGHRYLPITGHGVPVYQPLRLVFRPALLGRGIDAEVTSVKDLPLRNQVSRLSGIQYVLTGTVIPGIKGTKLGALDDTFKSGTEYIVSLGVSLDLPRLFRKPHDNVVF